jgi:RNA polymerase sigma-70 factor (ECF subfamily)
MCTYQNTRREPIRTNDVLDPPVEAAVLDGMADAPDLSQSVIEDRVRAQDSGVIEELIALYGGRLRRFLFRLTGDAELSEDLLQEIWIRVLARGSQFKGDSKLSTWLFAIARNLVFDLHRKRSFSMQIAIPSGADDDIATNLPSHDKSPFDRCAEEENARRLDQALRCLAPKQRKLIKLRYYGDLSLGEVARTTGIPLSSVKSTLYRSISLLRSRMDTALILPLRDLELTL